jgi:S-(hydroxymethyl)glutathione dehydrogenase/alcohol dehydrogenase
MRANVLQEPGARLTVEELDLAPPGLGEVRVRVVACGVCHTDLHVMKGEVAFPTPCVLGHEISGVVEEVGQGVTQVAPGDRVVCSFIMPCGTCRHCVRGHEDICETFFAQNRLRGTLYDGTSRLTRGDGSPVAMYSMAGLAEQAVVPATAVFPVPDSVPLREAAVLGCSIFTSVGAVRNVGQVQVGQSVAVVAAGGVGLNIVQVARAFGASTVVAVDVVPEKLELARTLGATHVVDAREEDHVEQVRAITGGRGMDVVFEALGSSGTVDTAIRLADDGGRVVLVGIAPAGVRAEFDITHVVRRKIQVLGSFGGRARADMPLVVDLAARGRINVAGVITDSFGLDEAGEAYDRLARGEIVGRAVIEVSPE